MTTMIIQGIPVEFTRDPFETAVECVALFDQVGRPASSDDGEAIPLALPGSVIEQTTVVGEVVAVH